MNVLDTQIPSEFFLKSCAALDMDGNLSADQFSSSLTLAWQAGLTRIWVLREKWGGKEAKTVTEEFKARPTLEATRHQAARRPLDDGKNCAEVGQWMLEVI